MNKEKALALFELADFKVEKIYKLENKYWPETPDHYEVRSKNPWWLILTKYGLIEIGWRKKVISIDWSATELRHEFFPDGDDVTKNVTMIHAWGYPKAVEYLISLRKKMEETFTEIKE